VKPFHFDPFKSRLARTDLVKYCGELKGFVKLEAILAEIEQTLSTTQTTTEVDEA